jgi:hypothetical protein
MFWYSCIFKCTRSFLKIAYFFISWQTMLYVSVCVVVKAASKLT